MGIVDFPGKGDGALLGPLGRRMMLRIMDTTPDAPAIPPRAPARLASIDAYRGAVMFLMMAEVLELAALARGSESPILRSLAYHQTHVAWGGCSVHDMIQPSFSFLVGVALPFSIASRRGRGESSARSVAHAAWRAFALVMLGVFLRSAGGKQTYFTFEDTLSQIGLGYLPLFLIARARRVWWWAALALILIGSWGAFAAYPVPGPDFDYASVGVKADWPHHASGLAAHWNKNSNLAWAFDRWFLNLFPRENPFTHNGGGYATLSFVPTLGTMLMGLIAGGWMIGEGRAWGKVDRLAAAGAASIALGLLADHLGVCPIVKRIWTPSWVLFSGGIALATLAALDAVVDVIGLRGWTYPLAVIGRNSIAAYVMAHLLDDFLLGSFKTHLGRDAFKAFGPDYEHLIAGAALLGSYWLILYWMDRRRIYLRV